MKQIVNNVETIGIKKITGITENGLVKIELVDGTTIGLAFHPTEPDWIKTVHPQNLTAAPVFENGILKGFSLRR